MNDITYTQHSDYLLPDLALSEQTFLLVGKYGLLRKAYLKTHSRILYTNLLTSGELDKHLADIDRQANDRLELVVKQMAAAQNVSEALKASDQIAWVGTMSNIRACAEEIVFREIIYT